VTRVPPLVSVVVAAYQADAYLEVALADAVAQSYPTVEVLVCDDAASADTARVVARLADPRVTYRANPTRLGPAGNHRAGLLAARGEFVAILNHDDRWDPEFLGRLVPPLAADPSVSIAFCDHHILSPDGRADPVRTASNTVRWGRDRLVPGRHADLAGLVVRQTIPLAMGSVFRRAAVDPSSLPDEAGPAYDLWLTYLLAGAGRAGFFVPDRLTGWREHPLNLTSAAGRDWAVGAALCWLRMRTDPAFAAHRPAAGRQLAAARRAAARFALRAGDRAAARAAAAAALRVRPADPKAAALLALAFAPRFVRRWLGC
jgi:glycosyltransferase involved in cell wall biosynthesis